MHAGTGSFRSQVQRSEDGQAERSSPVPPFVHVSLLPTNVLSCPREPALLDPVLIGPEAQRAGALLK